MSFWQGVLTGIAIVVYIVTSMIIYGITFVIDEPKWKRWLGAVFWLPIYLGLMIYAFIFDVFDRYKNFKKPTKTKDTL